MIRHAGRAAALFAVGALFASGAWAQAPTMAQSVEDRYIIAQELLGSADGTLVKLGSAGGGNGAADRPQVRLTVPRDTSVEAGNTAEITYTLTGASFAQGVGGRTLDLRGDRGVVAGLAAEVIGGGNPGDTSVTFEVEATASIAAGNHVTFSVPDLNVTPSTIGSTNTEPPLPVVGVGIVATVVEKRAVVGASDGSGPFLPASGGNDVPAQGESAAVNNVPNRQVVALAPVVGISFNDEDRAATVALGDRTAFATSNATYRPADATEATNALKVGTLTVSVTGTSGGSTIYTTDPAKPAVSSGDNASLDDSLTGDVSVIVEGNFQTGDQVIYGSPAQEAEIDGGMAAVEVPISASGSSTAFIYVPGGVDDLRPGTITAIAVLDFNAQNNNPGRPASSAATISYAGVDVGAYAYGVVRGGGQGDTSYLRVRCESGPAGAPATAGCQVFLDCHGQDGAAYFGEAGNVPTKGTVAWSSDDVAGVLGGGWSRGRGTCDVLSNGTVEVQHMVRSGTTLMNNSAVVGRDDLLEGRLADIKTVVDNICDSVDGHAGRDAVVDETTPANNVAAIAATACKNAIGQHGRQTVVDALDTNGADPGK